MEIEKRLYSDSVQPLDNQQATCGVIWQHESLL